MNSEVIIKRINEGIMDTKVDITYKEFVNILAELNNKDEKIKELKEYLILKEGISLLKDQKLLKIKNILPANVRFKKDSFQISDLKENT